MKKSPDRPQQIKLYTPLPSYKRKQFDWKTWIYILIAVLATALVVRFFDSVHYNNVLSQASQQSSTVENEQGKDINRLLQNIPGQINCQQFTTSFTQAACKNHDQ